MNRIPSKFWHGWFGCRSIGGLFYCALAFFPSGLCAQTSVSLYQIGNSLTFDSNPPLTVASANLAGLDLTSGYHVRTNSSLETIYNTLPGRTGATGAFNVALPGFAWDHVALQPFREQDTAMASDLAMLHNFIDLTLTNPANSNTQFYIYTSWQHLHLLGAWDDPVVFNSNTITTHARAYFEQLAEQILDDTGRRLYVIPVGDVIFKLDQEARAGRLPGFTSAGNVYRDLLHMNSAGSYLASATVLATTLGIDPRGMPVPDGFGDPLVLTPTRLASIQKIIWEVVVNHPYTGIAGPRTADITGDGDVDQADLDVWIADSINQPVLHADANGDRQVDEFDRDYWEFFRFLTPVEVASDFNQDGVVDTVDYSLWKNSYGSTTQLVADANQDGVIGASDYTIWQDGKAMNSYRQFADFNSDGEVDLLDLAIWEQEEGLAWELRADWNGNNILDPADIDIWRANYYDTQARERGDYNQDGIVDLEDFNVWNATLGSRYRLEADGNRDGEVNQADYALWLTFASAAGTQVPEPASIWIAAAALLLLVRPARNALIVRA